MKRKKYFQEELQKLFITYAILPAGIVTLVCVILMMAVFLHGKKQINQEQNCLAAKQMETLLFGYKQCLKKLENMPDLFEMAASSDGQSRIFEEIYDVSEETGYEAELYVLDKNGRPVFSNRENIPSVLEYQEGLSWGIYKEMEEHPGEIAVRLLNGWNRDESAIALGETRQRTGNKDGFLLFFLPGNRLKLDFDQTDVQTVIADRFGRVFFSSGDLFLTDSNQVAEELEYAGKYKHWNGQVYLVSHQKVCDQMFDIYSVSSVHTILASASMTCVLVLFALTLMTIWVFVRSKKITEKKTEDFYKILDVLERAGQGNLEPVIQIEQNSEFKIIADAYNRAVVTLREQMEKNQKMADLVAISQNKQLESQFNPHFLYNTLENIRYMCKLEPSSAEQMVLSLSRLLRYSLDGSKAEVALKEDMEHLEYYLSILKKRFGSRLSCHIETEPETLNCMIPKLILQPMIENAVKYGFGNLPALDVELKAYIHEEKLKLICRDNGVGMSQAMLRQMEELLEQKENPSRHSGLYNIHRRIILLYGMPHGVEIRSAKGYGTTLVVTLPVKREEEAECFGC